jgi:hypothetical protein
MARHRSGILFSERSESELLLKWEMLLPTLSAQKRRVEGGAPVRFQYFE